MLNNLRVYRAASGSGPVRTSMKGAKSGDIKLNIISYYVHTYLYIYIYLSIYIYISVCVCMYIHKSTLHKEIISVGGSGLDRVGIHVFLSACLL